MQQKQRTIKGTVSDEYGEPLIGVSVLVQGTTTGTITDIDGNYTLEILNDEAVLEFSYIGYQKISLRVAGASSFNIIMKEDAQQLNEVVVTAMGIERKEKSLTYATQQVKGDELMKVQDANFVNALSGKASELPLPQVLVVLVVPLKFCFVVINLFWVTKSVDCNRRCTND